MPKATHDFTASSPLHKLSAGDLADELGAVKAQHIDRRALLKGTALATAAAALTALPVLAPASPQAALAIPTIPPTPELVALAEERRRVMRALDRAIDPSAEREAFEEQLWPTWEAVVNFPSRSAADLLVKVELGLEVYEGSDTKDLIDDLMPDMRRLAKAGCP